MNVEVSMSAYLSWVDCHKLVKDFKDEVEFSIPAFDETTTKEIYLIEEVYLVAKKMEEISKDFLNQFTGIEDCEVDLTIRTSHYNSKKEKGEGENFLVKTLLGEQGFNRGSVYEFLFRNLSSLFSRYDVKIHKHNRCDCTHVRYCIYSPKTCELAAEIQNNAKP